MALAAATPLLQWNGQPPAARDMGCVLLLQEVAKRFVTNHRHSSQKKLQDNARSTEPLTVP